MSDDDVRDVIDQVQAVRPQRQCPSTFIARSGRGANITFCTEREGHEGCHRGMRKRWDDAGNLIAPVKKATR